MRNPVGRRILVEMLEGKELEESDLRELIRVWGESLHVDFKNGRELDDPGKAAKTVRQYVAGFANADGGLLVVGVSDGGGDPEKRTFTGTKRPGGQALPEWARNVLTVMAGGLSPAPRMQAITVEGNDVLVIGVARAPALVPCVEDGELKYYLRVGDSTPAIPPYLISDLILGRRVHPQLQVKVGENGCGAANGAAVHFGFEVDNEGMIPAIDVLVGVVSWGLRPPDSSSGRLTSGTIRNFIDASAIPLRDGGAEQLVLVHVTSRQRQTTLNLAAFETGLAGGIGKLLVDRPSRTISVRSALYVLASGHPPDWYQLDWTIPPPQETRIRATLTRLANERPVVVWDSPASPEVDNH
jgi:hypothetical protein